jgi:formiminotetrahydrofolate cyclodeaminase
MSLVAIPVQELLSRFSSTDPTPGGGSASALGSAVGASLLAMVAGLPKTRSGSEDDRTALSAAANALAGIRQQLTDAIDADASAYDQVIAAYTRPKASADEQAARRAAIQGALRAATDVPLGVMRLSALALEQANVVAAHGYRSASSDTGVAIALLVAGTAGARLNVGANLEAVTDAGYRDSVRAESQRLMEKVGDDAARAESLLLRTG